MLNKLKNNKGFTIIEVMIVLAIAGLIILVVLLAVPALQRNSRNTALKNDASAIAAAVTEYESNNDGKVPGFVSNTAPTITVCDAATCTAGVSQGTAKIQSSTTVTYSTTAPAVPLTNGTVYVVSKFKCNNGDAYAATSDIVASNRGTVVIYPVEQASGNPVGRCIDS